MILREWVKSRAENPAGPRVDPVRQRAMEPRSDPYSRLIETAANH
ncbi:MAG: hypothetical protein ABJM58_08935 [Alteripontixanthobacter sp.]